MTPTITKPPFTPHTTTTPAAQKQNFVQNAGAKPQVLKAPRKKAFTLDEDDAAYFKMLAFGTVGSGKTKIFADLVLGGYKVAVLSTDIGDTGHLTIVNRLRAAGRMDLLKNCLIIPRDGYKEVNAFLTAPEKDCPELFDMNPDFLGWDGFGAWQQVDVSEYVGEMAPAKDKDRGDFRESGLVLEQQDWGAIRNATIRRLNDFIRIHHPSGKKWHKILTCHEQIIYRETTTSSGQKRQEQVQESYKPMLSGAGGTLALGGVDLVLRCKVSTKKGLGEDKDTRVYTYVTRGHENLVAKDRGFNLDAEEPADFLKLWSEKISKSFVTGINQPASD